MKIKFYFPYLISIIFIMILILIISNITLYRNIKNTKKETFDQNQDTPIISDRIHFFRIGLGDIFTPQKNILNLSDKDFMDWITKYVYIWPNYQDFCCKAMQNKNEDIDCACNNIHILNSSCYDDSMHFFNEPRVNSIEGNIGAPNTSNCTMTLMGNNYLFLKKSISLILYQPILQVGLSDFKLYRLTITENVLSIVLTNPMFMSFNTAGLYQVIHEDIRNPTGMNEYENKKSRNAFAFYSSLNKEPKHIYLKKINNSESLNFFSDTNTNIYRTFEQNKRYTATLYYLSYKSEIKNKNSNSNVLSFVINDKSYINDFKINNKIEIITDKNDSSHVRVFTVIKNDNGTLFIKINNYNDEEIFYIPEEFPYVNAQQLTKFDICITYAFNVLYIVCYGVEKITRKNVCVCVRYHPQNKQLDISKDIIKNVFKNQASSMYYYVENNIKDVMNFTSIPNFAKLAYKLGYNFNIN